MNKKNILYEFLKNFFLNQVATILIPKKDRALPKDIFKEEKYQKISYCTTCMGRTFHLKKTYLKNISDNLNYPRVEFILINYNSQDNMDEWVKQELSSYIEKGLVVYYKTNNPEEFHMGKAKNLSHRLATGDILVNLDADNFTGKDNAFYLNYISNRKGNGYIFQFSKRDFRFFDTSGRIAVSKKDFYLANGYREDLLPFASEDQDFIKRLELAGGKTIQIGIINFLRSLKHDNKLRLSNLKTNQNMEEIRKINDEMVRVGLEKRIIKANQTGFEKFEVYKNFSNVSVIV